MNATRCYLRALRRTPTHSANPYLRDLFLETPTRGLQPLFTHSSGLQYPTTRHTCITTRSHTSFLAQSRSQDSITLQAQPILGTPTVLTVAPSHSIFGGSLLSQPSMATPHSCERQNAILVHLWSPTFKKYLP